MHTRPNYPALLGLDLLAALSARNGNNADFRTAAFVGSWAAWFSDHPGSAKSIVSSTKRLPERPGHPNRDLRPARAETGVIFPLRLTDKISGRRRGIFRAVPAGIAWKHPTISNRLWFFGSVDC
jgi:hypothetical protein